MAMSKRTGMTVSKVTEDIYISLRFDLKTLLANGFQSLVLHSLGSKVRVRVLHPEQTFRGDVGIGPNFPQSVYMAHQSNIS